MECTFVITEIDGEERIASRFGRLCCGKIDYNSERSEDSGEGKNRCMRVSNSCRQSVTCHCII
jgi:hypothetical protein